jgi:hypothetical protein
MIRPKKDTATIAHEEDLKKLSDMQLSCMRGEVSENDFNAHLEAEKIRLVGLGVMPGMLPTKIINGECSL